MGGGDRRDREDRSDEYRDREPSGSSVADAQKRLDGIGSDTASGGDQVGGTSDAGGAGGAGAAANAGNIEQGGNGEEGAADSEGGVTSGTGSREEQNPSEWARATLTPGAVAPRHKPGGEGGQRAIPIEEASGRIGGWDEYDPENASRVTLLEDIEATSGRTEAFMERVDLNADGQEQAGAKSAFVTHYRDGFRPEPEHQAPMKRSAQNQMTAYAFMDAMGARVPRHTYDPEREWVASEGIEGYAINDIAYSPLDREMGEAARNVDREEFIEANAVQLLAGNRDLHGGNLFVEPDGTVQSIDLDLAGYEYDDLDDFRRSTRKATRASETLASRRGEGSEVDEAFEVERDEIVTRAQEIAVALDEGGQIDRVVAAPKAYDDVFDEKRRPVHEAIRNNIEMLVRSVRGEPTAQSGGRREETSDESATGDGPSGSQSSEDRSDRDADDETSGGGLDELFESGGGLDDIFGRERSERSEE